MPSLMEFKGEELPGLKYDNFTKDDFWILSDGISVTIAEQRTGESPTQEIHVPKATFDYLVKKYAEQQ